MKRRHFLAAAGVATVGVLAGCTGDDDDDTGADGFPVVAEVDLVADAADLKAEAAVTRQFTDEQPGGIWTRLTNTGSSSIELEFAAWATPYFYRAEHTDDEEARLVITDEINSPNTMPSEPDEGCWRTGYPPRQPTSVGHRLGVDASITSLYFLTAPTGEAGCLPAGTYDTTYGLDVAERVHPIDLTLTVELEE